MKKLLIALMTGSLLLSISVKGQQTDADMKAWTDYMTPGDFHKLLAKYNGDWDEKINLWMQPGAPPQQYQSIAKNEMLMGGRYQVSKTSGTMMGMPFEGMSILGYDNSKKVFTSTWIDNFGTGIMTLNGIWDEKSKPSLLPVRRLTL
jgi:hypothetical protein